MLTYLRITTRYRTERGASAVEYAMLVAMVAVMIGVVYGLGKALSFVFDQTAKNNGISSSAP